MAKRFTDTNKWRNEWFRTLPLKAKLTWIYLCDECDHAGVWKSDFGLASFQLGFSINQNDLNDWFKEKIHFFNKDSLLILPFFTFQYGESKDSWNAKVKAREKLQNLGFTLINNTIVINDSPTTVGGQSPDCLGIDIVIVKGKVKGNKGGVGEKFDFESVYEKYPRKEGKAKAFEVLKKTISNEIQFAALKKAIENYSKHCDENKIEHKFIRLFNTFIGPLDAPYWPDWVNPSKFKPDPYKELREKYQDEVIS